jgi:UDP-glucuronate decarboxylase
LPDDDPVRRCPDIGLAREKLSWAPRTTLEDGLAKTISYFNDLLNGATASTPERKASD